MSERVVALVLAGGRVDDLSVLTAERPKSAVPIWGMYRLSLLQLVWQFLILV